MTWFRKVLGYLRRPSQRDPDLARTREHHVRTLQKADRVIDDYRRLDGVLLVHVRRR